MLKLLLLLCYILSDGIIRAQSPEVKRGNIWEKAGKFEGDILLDDDTIEARNIYKNKLWPKGIIPYTVDEDIGKIELSVIKEAMRRVQNSVNVLARKEKASGEGCQLIFRERTSTDPSYVKIVKSPNEYECSSFVGRLRRGGGQKLLLAPECFSVGTITHELLHVLGFEHQQSSPNRDDYVTIHTENIDAGYENQFKKKSWKRYTTFNTGYDYNSIMHYSGYAYAKTGPDGDFVGPTITNKLHPKKPIEVRNRLSAKDKQKLRYMYCPELNTVNPYEDYGTDED